MIFTVMPVSRSHFGLGSQIRRVRLETHRTYPAPALEEGPTSLEDALPQHGSRKPHVTLNTSIALFKSVRIVNQSTCVRLLD